MKVLFIKNLRGKGTIGDIKEVSDGYAMNFLITNNYAVKATPEVIQKQKKNILETKKRTEVEFEEISTIFNTIKGKSLSITVSAKDLSGKLYKGVTIKEIISEVRKEFNIYLKSDWFHNYKPIKEIGAHEVELQSHNLSVNFKINIT